MRIPSGKVDQVAYFVAVDSTDLKTRKTGLTTFTVYRSRNNGVATIYTTPTVTELSAANMPGVYSLLIDEDTTIAAASDSEEYVVHITQATMAPVTRSLELYRRTATSGQTLDVSATGGAGIDWANVENPTTALGLSGTTVGTVTTTTTATNVTTVNGLAANVITAAATAADFSTEVRSLASGTSDSGTTTTMVDAARTEADTDYWKGQLIVFTSGVIAGQARVITGFNVATDTITFAPAATQAVATQTYEIWPVGDYLRPTTSGNTLDVNATGEAGLDWANIGGPTSAQTLSGTTVGTATAVTTVNGLAANVVTAASIAAAAMNGKGDWNIGKTGYALSAAGVQAIWDALTTALTVVGSIGKLLVDNINATISSRSSHTAADVWASAARTLTAATNITSTGGTTVPQTGDSFARLGAPVGASISADIATRATPAQVNTEVVDALAVDTYVEPGQGAPAATTTIAAKINYLYKAWRNRTTQTSTTYSLYADDAITVDQKATVADDGTTFSRTEIATGP